MNFSPAFYLLTKFSIGLKDFPKSNDDIAAVANYLGKILLDENLDDHIKTLAEELRIQNGFLSKEIGSDDITQSSDYERSMFIREVVANNKINAETRLKRES